MRIKLQEFIDKSPDTYFTFEGLHYKLHLNSQRDYLALYNQNASKNEILISKDNKIDNLYIEHDHTKKQLVIYRKDSEFINFEYLSNFAYNMELSKQYK